MECGFVHILSCGQSLSFPSLLFGKFYLLNVLSIFRQGRNSACPLAAWPPACSAVRYGPEQHVCVSLLEGSM